MEKSFNLIVKETKQNIIDVLNNSNLPIIVSTMILNELFQSLNMQASQQTDIDAKLYKESLKPTSK